MKRLAVLAFYGIGALAIGYLALYAYAVFTGRDLQPGDPIHIFRKPDAPSYSCGGGGFRLMPGDEDASQRDVLPGADPAPNSSGAKQASRRTSCEMPLAAGITPSRRRGDSRRSRRA